MQVTKITFSDEEMEAMQNARFFEVKKDVVQKVMELFAVLERNLKKEIAGLDFQFENLEVQTGKIFKGESYKNLPYIVLDYPKLFSADNVFTFRSMFWWGNEFSFTLHLQGRALEKLHPVIRKNIDTLLDKGFYFCVNHSPWQYAFTEDNYIPLEKVVDSEFPETLSREFIKLSRKIQLDEYLRAVNYGVETFTLLKSVLK
jgi:hypothetical protein